MDSSLKYKYLRFAIRNMRIRDELYILLLEELSPNSKFVLSFYNRLSETIRIKILKRELTKYGVLRDKLHKMKRWHPIYSIVKSELAPMGYWRLKSRGDPSKGFKSGFGKHQRSFKHD